MRWQIWALNVVVIAILAGMAHSFRLLGWEIALAFAAGFFFCYAGYGCWRVDYERERRADFTDRR